MPNPLSSGQKFLTVCISLLLGCVLALALGEIWLRTKAPGAIRLMHDHIILPKNQVYVYDNTQLRGCDPRIVHHKNSLGFRGPELPADFASRLSVVAVGGSTTECFYLSDGHSWPELVGEQLAKTFPQLWMNNAGLDGHSTFGHQILVRDYLVQLHPKVILFLVGVNDVGRDDLVVSDKAFLKKTRDTTALKRVMRRLEEKSYVAAWIENLIRAFSAWKRGLAHRSLDLTTAPVLTLPAVSTADLLQQHSHYLAGYESRLEALVALCRESGIRPVFLTQPALFGKGRDPITGVNLETLEIDKSKNGRLVWQTLELYNDRTRKVAKKNSLLLIDLARDLPKTSAYFYDFYHFTNAGAEATASIVARELRPFLAKP